MLSIVPLKSAQAAKNYYEKDNYYVKDSLEMIAASCWYGQGAELLGLEGVVTKPAFEALLEGKLPTGERLGRIENGEHKHRPGYDLTFSAPKSVSIISEVMDDIRLQQAHDEAVKEALTYLEKVAIQTRTFKQGEIVFESANNITCALFRHDTSRELDPQLHTHAVLMNMLRRQDGKWRSISSESLFDHKMTAGMVYRAKLASLCHEIGYSIEKTHTDGRFELSCVPQDLITQFSKRRQQVEAKLQENETFGSKSAEDATLQSRRRKREVCREKLAKKWLVEMGEDYTNLQTRIGELTSRNDLQANRKALADQFVTQAINHLSERESVFSQQQIIRETLAFGVGEITLDDTLPTIDQVLSDSILLGTETPLLFTTTVAKALEEQCIKHMKAEQNTVKSILPGRAIDTYFATSTLKHTQGQMDAAKLILTTKDRFVGIQGDAGTGKTTMLKAVRAMAEESGMALIGLSAQKEAALVLEEKAGIESMTVARFLMLNSNQSAQIKDNTAPTLAILDEASMLSTRDMIDLMQIAIHQNIRFVFVGDTKQLASCNAGKPFWVLQQFGMAVALMNSIVRQAKTGPGGLIRAAIKHIEQEDYDQALRYVTVREDDNREKRLDKVVREYLNYSKTGRDNTLLLIPRNTDRVDVNHLIRSELKVRGELTGDEFNTHILVSQNLSKEQILQANNYQVGDIMQFNIKLNRIPSNTYFEVISKNHKENTIQFCDQQNNIHQLALEKLKKFNRQPISLYRHDTRTLMAGDRIRWTKNHNNRVNGCTAEVLSVNDNKAIIKLHNGKTSSLALSSHQHWEYAFALTTHAAQGKDKPHIIAHMESFSKPLTHQNMLYTIVSRGELDVTLVVDNKEACIKSLEKNTGVKLSALESLGLIPDWKDNIDKEEKSKVSIPYKPTKERAWDADLLQSRLSDCAESLCKHLLGEPNHSLSNKQNLRYGNKGSLSISLTGKHAGTWKNFESGESGNLIQLIQAHGYGFKEALDYAGGFLGLSPEIKSIARQEKHLVKAPNPVEPSLEDKKAMATARKIVLHSEPIHNTPAENYLRQHRAITCKLGENYRYHPALYEPTTKQKLPALICIAKNHQGEIHAAQAIYLDPNTHNKADIAIKKRTFGRLRFAAGVASGNEKTNHIYIAEGPETALSIQSAMPSANVTAALSVSNMAKIALPKQIKSVTLCLDNDGDNAVTNKAIQKARNHFIGKGLTVEMIKPEAEGMDFNDVLQQQGVEKVADILIKDLQNQRMQRKSKEISL